VFEVHGEGNVVYSDVCGRYRVKEMLCTVSVFEAHGEGNVVYSDLWLLYRVKEILCSVMCVYGTG